MAGERTVKIKFTGESKGLDRAAKAAEKSMDSFGSNVTKSVGKVAAGIPDIFAGVVSAMPPQGQLIAGVLTAGLAVAMGPMLAAAITSAVLMAVGGGVLALGIKSAIDNPKVAAAFDSLKTKASKIFENFGKPFEAPLIRAAKTFEKVLGDLEPHIQELGRIMAPVIDKLAPALGEFFKAVMPGIKDAVKASVPLFETLAAKLPKIGEAIGLFFTKISENGDDANQFFSDMLDLIAGLIVGFGVVIGKLASWYSDLRAKLLAAKDQFVVFKASALDQLGRLLDGAVSALGWIPGIGPKLRSAQRDFQKFRAEANQELQKIKDKHISITFSTNIGRVAGEIASKTAGILASGGQISGRRASGGPVSAGRSYLVGERGPEVITMGSSGGRVTPNHELGGGGGDTYVYIGGEALDTRFVKVIRQHDRDTKRRAGAY